jgi:4-hydroxybenzoate polyprenyltransferase
MVLLLTALVAFASTAGSPDAGPLALLLLAMLSSQLAIGWSNDYLDREVDALHQPSKPLPSGLVDSHLMPPAIALVLAVSVVAGVFLGVIPLLLLAIGTSCGLAYNLGLKRTHYSAAPFLVAFTVLPVFVWTALDVYRSDLLALYPIGLTLPIAVHIANVLPDIESDGAQGRRTIAVALGRTPSVVLSMACQLAPLPLTVLSFLWLDYDLAILAPSLAAYAVLSLAAGLLYRRGGARDACVWAFRAIVVAAIVFAGGWLAAA